MRPPRWEREPHVPLENDPAAGPQFAPAGQLTAVDSDALVVCHACGELMELITAGHLRRHDLTPATYRARFGLNRSQPLAAPRLVRDRRVEGRLRFETNPALRAGLAQGQAMARDGSLLALSHAAQPPGSRRAQARAKDALAAAAPRGRRQQEAERARQDRVAQLGFDDEASYLRHRYQQRGWNVTAIAREWHTHTSAVLRALRAHDIPARPAASRGSTADT